MTIWTHSFYLAMRTMRESLRQPGVEVGNIFIPLFFFAVIIGSVSNIAGSAFGVEDFTSFHRRWRRHQPGQCCRRHESTAHRRHQWSLRSRDAITTGWSRPHAVK